MTQIYHYGVAALFIEVIVIFFYFQKRSLATFQNIVFLIILSDLTIATCLELGVIYMEDNMAKFHLNSVWLMECLYFTFNTTFGILFAVYNLSAFDIYSRLKKRTIRIVQISMLIPYFLCMALIWFSFILKDYVTLTFTLDPVEGYVRGNNIFFYLLCATKAFYILFAFFVILSFQKQIPKSKMQIMYFFLVTSSVTAFMQLFNNELLIESFGMALVTLVYFFFIQKPEEMMDSATDTLNQSALLRMLRYNLTVRRKIYCIAVYIDDTVFIANTFGLSYLHAFLKEVGNYFKQQYNYSNVFSRQQGCFCILLRDADEEKLNEVLYTLNSRFQKTWICDNVELKLYIRLCIIECPKDAESSEEVFDIINMISTDERYRQSVVFASEIPHSFSFP